MDTRIYHTYMHTDMKAALGKWIRLTEAANTEEFTESRIADPEAVESARQGVESLTLGYDGLRDLLRNWKRTHACCADLHASVSLVSFAVYPTY